jgi:uncharacterized metal-binding protein
MNAGPDTPERPESEWAEKKENGSKGEIKMEENKKAPEEPIERLYSQEDRKLMRSANDAMLPGKNRLDEIMAFARSAGIRRLGIANCVALQHEADKLAKILFEGFEVYCVSCKTGKIPREEFAGEGAKGISCNPAGQAAFLAQKSTELNISLGLCMGHDIVFSLKSKAPVTALIVKDKMYKHNPARIFEEK